MLKRSRDTDWHLHIGSLVSCSRTSWTLHVISPDWESWTSQELYHKCPVQSVFRKIWWLTHYQSNGWTQELILIQYEEQHNVATACSTVALDKQAITVWAINTTQPPSPLHTHSVICCHCGRMSNPMIQCWQRQGPQHSEARRAAFWESEQNKYES